MSERGKHGEIEPGEVVAIDTNDGRRRTAALVDAVQKQGIDLVVFHALTSPVETNVARYLPDSVLRLLIVHNITPSTYRGAVAIRDSVHATVGVSPRIVDDLVRNHGFNRRWTVSIPNSVETSAFCHARPVISGTPLRVLSVGRIENRSKGVLWIPRIVQKAILAGVAVSLTLAGEGPDASALEWECRKHGLDAVTRVLGWVSREDMPNLMQSHDVLLFPSRYEGFGLTLIEAMAAGCVPVASSIRGVTDSIIRHGETGLLFRAGDISAAAAHIIALATNRALLSRLQCAAQKAAASAYSVEAQANSYASLIEKISSTRLRVNAPQPLDHWRLAREFRPGWWHALPEWMKNWARVARERVRTNSRFAGFRQDQG
jgi:glycosyltransferase involved in cell wall biosynthesis